jgi:hypothetical protein
MLGADQGCTEIDKRGGRIVRARDRILISNPLADCPRKERAERTSRRRAILLDDLPEASREVIRLQILKPRPLPRL